MDIGQKRPHLDEPGSDGTHTGDRQFTGYARRIALVGAVGDVLAWCDFRSSCTSCATLRVGAAGLWCDELRVHPTGTVKITDGPCHIHTSVYDTA
jgi:hypothetical protein